MAVLDAAYYGVCIYSRVPDPCLYPAPNDLFGGELVPLFRLPPTLPGSIRQFGIEEAARDSRYLAGHAEPMFNRMEGIVWDETPHPSYCQYSWDDDSFLD